MIRCRIEPDDTLFDVYGEEPPGAQGTILQPGSRPVGDLSLRVVVRPERAGGFLTLTLHDATHGEALTARVSAGGGPTTIAQGDRELETCQVSLEPGVWTRIRFDNLDDRLSLSLGGDELLAAIYVHDPAQAGEGFARHRAGFSLGGEDVELGFRDPALFRDIHYVSKGQTRFLIPENHYLFLGDNSGTSEDSRYWRRTALRVAATGAVLEGDSQGVTVRSIRPPGRNPWMKPDGSYGFVDHLGTIHRFASQDDFEELGSWPTPYVPREFFLGRGIMVLLPMGRTALLR
jgi:hypothetical protein